MEHISQQIEEPIKAKRADPKTRYDYCYIISRLINQPVGAVLFRTHHWPHTWFIELQSECKEKDRITQIKIICKWLREAKLKEISTPTPIDK